MPTRQAERELAERGDLRSLLDALPILVSWVGRDLRYRIANHAYEQWFKVQRGAIVGSQMVDVLGTEAMSVLQPMVDRALAGETVRFERTVPYSTGARTIDATYLPTRDEAGAVSGFIVLVEDISARVESAKEAKQSRELLSAVLSNVADGITAVDAAGRVVFANEASAAAVGARSPEEMMQATASLVSRFELVDENGKPLPADKLPNRLALASGEPREALIGWRPKDGGELQWNHVRSSPVKDADGRVQLVVSVSRSMTEARRRAAADKLLSEASALLSRSLQVEETVTQIANLAVPALADWVIVDLVDRPGEAPRRIAVQHADPAKLEWAREVERRWPPIWNPDAPAGMPAVVRTGKPERMRDVPPELLEQSARDPEHREILRKLGLKSYMCVPLPGHANQVLGALTLLSTEGGRRYEESDLAAAVELGRRAGIALDNARLFREVQQQAARSKLVADASRAFSLVGHEPQPVLQEIVTRTAQVLRDGCVLRMLSDDGATLDLAAFHHLDPATMEIYRDTSKSIPAREGLYAEVIRSGHGKLVPKATPETMGFETKDLKAFTAKLPFHTMMVAPLRSHGRVYGVLAVSRSLTREPYTESDLVVLEDLADRAALAIENARLIANSEAANRQKDDFIAMLAHELRNPLAPMFNATQLMSMPNVPAKTVDRAREVLDRQLKHLSRLVDDLLDVSRISRGKIDLRRETFDACELVKEVVMDRVEAFRSAGIAIDVECQPGGHVFADRTRVAQVLGNLLSNALKFTPRDGHVKAKAWPSAAEARVWISVTDTGIGIDRTRLSDVFDAFVQEQSSLDRSRGGLGLGLAVVKGIALLHGGGVSADSAGPGKGSEFKIWLPLERGASAHAPDKARASNVRSRRVLVVDDNLDLAETVADLLQAEGHVVETETSGEKAVERIRKMRPEIVLCDIGLPGKDGYAIATEVRADPTLNGVKMIAISGYGMAADKQRAKSAGFAEHLTKPVEPQRLYSLLESL